MIDGARVLKNRSPFALPCHWYFTLFIDAWVAFAHWNLEISPRFILKQPNSRFGASGLGNLRPLGFFRGKIAQKQGHGRTVPVEKEK